MVHIPILSKIAEFLNLRFSNLLSQVHNMNILDWTADEEFITKNAEDFNRVEYDDDTPSTRSRTSEDYSEKHDLF